MQEKQLRITQQMHMKDRHGLFAAKNASWFPEVATTMVASFLVPNIRQSARLWFLRCALTSQRNNFVSPFCKFQFQGGGIAGTINSHEDILDRIMSYLE